VSACTQPGYLPRFQAQNPAISHDPNGWVNCTAYAAAMAGDFDSCGSIALTGERIRSLSSEPVPDPKSPGLNLRQVDDALNRYGVDLETRYRLPWADFVRKIDKGEGAILQGATGPLLSTTYRSTAGDINHAIFVPPGWGAMDPAADGRKTYHEYDGKPYPRDLLKRFAGHLEVTNGVRLGLGYVYAAFTRDRRSTWTWQFDPIRNTGPLHTFTVRNGVIVGHRKQIRAGTRVYKSGPPKRYPWPGHTSAQTLVPLGDLVAGGKGDFTGQYAHARYAEEIP